MTVTVTPTHKVIYKNRLYYAGVPFEADAEDAEEMANFGTVTQHNTAGSCEQEMKKSERKRKAQMTAEVVESNDGTRDHYNDTNADRGHE